MMKHLFCIGIIYLGCISTLYAAPSPLHEAAARGDLERVKELYETHKDLTQLNHDGYTVLYEAIHSGKLAVVEFLVKNGADVNGANSNEFTYEYSRGDTPLHVAVRFPHKADIVRFLVKNGANVAVKSFGYTVLYEAVRNNNLPVVEFLVESGADVNEANSDECKDEDDRGTMPLHRAARSGYLDVVDFLVQNGAKIEARDSNGDTPLSEAAFHAQEEVVLFLIQKGANKATISDYTKSMLQKTAPALYRYLTHSNHTQGPLYEAVQKGDLEYIKHALAPDNTDKDKSDKNKLDINKWTLLHHAVYENSYDIVKFLVEEAEVDITIKNKDGQTPFTMHNSFGRTFVHELARKGDLEFLERLVNKHNVAINIQDKEDSPLHGAISENKKKVIEWLLQHNADCSLVNESQMTPLHLAAQQRDNSEIIERLINQPGALINLPDRLGRTPLHYAARSHDLASVKLLLKQNRVKASDQDERGRTSLHYAAQSGNLELVQFLLQQDGVDVFQQDKDQRTCLHHAAKAQFNEVELTKFLVEEKKLEPHQRDGKELRPVDYAARKNLLEIVIYLSEQKGFELNMITGKKEHSTGRGTLLYHAIQCKNKRVARFLLEQPGIDVNAPGWSRFLNKNNQPVRLSQTPLQRATLVTQDMDMETVNMLLDAGANLYTKDNYGYSALSWMEKEGVAQATIQAIKNKAAAAAKERGIPLPAYEASGEENPEDEHKSITGIMKPLILGGIALSLGSIAFYLYKKWKQSKQLEKTEEEAAQGD